jgi:hypothetical protein
MVMTTGIGMPFSSFWVCALNALQNSMMLRPRWPSAGPIGGDGLAAPAGTCNFISSEKRMIRVDEKEERREDRRHQHHHDRGDAGLPAGRPDHLGDLGPHLLHELKRICAGHRIPL